MNLIYLDRESYQSGVARGIVFSHIIRACTRRLFLILALGLSFPLFPLYAVNLHVDSGKVVYHTGTITNISSANKTGAGQLALGVPIIGAAAFSLSEGTLGINNGAAPNSLSTTTFMGSFTQGPAGTLQMDILKTGADQVIVTGPATLNGQIELVFGPGTCSNPNPTVLPTVYTLLRASAIDSVHDINDFPTIAIYGPGEHCTHTIALEGETAVLTFRPTFAVLEGLTVSNPGANPSVPRLVIGTAVAPTSSRIHNFESDDDVDSREKESASLNLYHKAAFTGPEENNLLKSKNGIELWAKGTTGYLDNGTRKTIPGFSVHVNGVGVGIDWPWTDCIKGGFSLTYNYAGVAYKNAGVSSTDINALTFATYGSWHPNHRWFLNTILALGGQRYTSVRDTLISGLARATFYAKELSLEGSIGRIFKIKGGFDVTPSVKLDGTLFHQNGYTEQGSHNNITMKSMRTKLCDATASLKFGHTSAPTQKWLLKPHISCGLTYDFNPKPAANSVIMDGTAFPLQGPSQPKTASQAGCGFRAELHKTLSFDIDFVAVFKRKSRSYNGQAKIALKF